MSKGTCVLCFALNAKIFDIRDTHLQSVYEEISDFKIQTDSHCLCYICHIKLQQCYLLVKQAHNLQRSPQDDSNRIEHKSLVQLSTLKMENSSIAGEVFCPRHETMKQEPDIKAENSDYLNEEHLEINSEDFKRETVEEPSTSYSYSIELKQDISIHTDLKEDCVEDKPDSFKGEEEGETGRFKEPKRTHKGGKTNSCDICNKKLRDSSSLEIHYRTHTGAKPYSCGICNKRFGYSGSLKMHIRTHTNDKPYSCDICNERFCYSSSLKKHIRTHTGDKPYNCDVCSKRFSNNSGLKMHIRIHTGDKPYICDICNMRFSHSGNLKAHKRTHTGDKPYGCYICNKRFNQNASLKMHYRTHTGAKPYACDICNERFCYSSSLKMHIRTHTGDKPYGNKP